MLNRVLSLIVANRGLFLKAAVTLLALVAFRALAHVPSPGLDTDVLTPALLDVTLGWLFVTGSSAAGTVGLVSLGVGPLIMASIATQVGARSVPWLREMKAAPGGAKQVAVVTRRFAVGIAALQGVSIAFSLKRVGGTAGYSDTFLVAFSLVVGALMVMWLADRISRNGLGGGMTLLIAWGTLGPLGRVVEQWFTTGPRLAGVAVVVTAAIVACVVWATTTERRLPVLVGSPGVKLPQGGLNYLPLAVLAGGVMPVIFARAVATAPMSIAGWWEPAAELSEFIAPGTVAGAVLVGALTGFFVVAYLPIALDPWKISDQLMNSGRFIPGVAPGEETARVIGEQATRMAYWGAAALVALVTVPELLPAVFNGFPELPYGTDLVIVAGASAALLRRVQAEYAASACAGRIRRNFPAVR